MMAGEEAYDNTAYNMKKKFSTGKCVRNKNKSETQHTFLSPSMEKSVLTQALSPLN